MTQFSVVAYLIDYGWSGELARTPVSQKLQYYTIEPSLTRNHAQQDYLKAGGISLIR